MFWILSKTDEQLKLGCFYTEKWALRPGETKVQGYHPHFQPLFPANLFGADLGETETCLFLWMYAHMDPDPNFFLKWSESFFKP